MELIKLTESQIIDMGLHYKPTKLTKLVDEFIESGEFAMEVRIEKGEYASPSNCTSSIKSYLKRSKKTWVDAKTVRGKVYIFKTGDRPIEDEVRVCVDCGKQFILTANNKKWCLEKGMTPFIRCEECRETRRKNNNTSYNLGQSLGSIINKSV